jgi:hypothetical protein
VDARAILRIVRDEDFLVAKFPIDQPVPRNVLRERPSMKI